jgi:hypothetical protein
LKSDDGKLVLICHYDVTNELAFCDVYWFPLQATQGEVAQPDVVQPALSEAAAAPVDAVLAE